MSVCWSLWQCFFLSFYEWIHIESQHKAAFNPAHLHPYKSPLWSSDLKRDGLCIYRLLTVRRWRAGLVLLTWHCCAQLLLILLHPVTYSRGLDCVLLGVTLVAVHNVGAHAALPCLMQDWALHGKKTRKRFFVFVREWQGRAVLCVCVCVCWTG